MPQQPPRGSSGLAAAALSFEAKVDNEGPLIDAMLASMARGALPADAWKNLHEAAHRDDRLSEVAFAFEGVAQGKRLRAAPPAVAAAFLFQAGVFFGDVFSDEAGAVAYFERALALAPHHPEALARLDDLLAKQHQPRRLAELYASTAQHRARGEQVPLLRRAAELFAEAGGAEDKIVDLLQNLLRLEPGDDDARSRLEALYVRGNRFRDVVRLNEQALTADPPPSDGARGVLLARIIELYADRLQEPERALPHVEQLLALDPAHEGARAVAQKLVVIKGIGGRAAAALATAFEASGTPEEVVRFVTLELDSTRGPRRAALLAKLGRLRADRLGDDAGAFDAFEQALAIDPSDDDVRARYAALGSKLERYADAAKTLSRALAAVKDPHGKAKTGARLGELLLRAGETKRAKTMLAVVLAATDAPPDAVRIAAYALREIYEGERQHEGEGKGERQQEGQGKGEREAEARALCDVLERIVGAEPDEERRLRADEDLAELAARLHDVPRAIAAYERLAATPARGRALEALAPLYAGAGDAQKHARVLEERANDTADAAQARDLLLRAAEVRARDAKDAPGAIATCRFVVDRFGPARDVLAMLMPLLESQRRWPDLAEALAQDASLAGEGGREQAEILARLGCARMTRLHDAAGALDAFQQAIAFDPHEKTARATLEKLAAVGDHRVAAGRVLEPLYRREGAKGALLKVLEHRGGAGDDLDERLAAWQEAAVLASEGASGEPGRALDLVGRGLADAAAHGRPCAGWLEAFDSLVATASGGADPKRRAAILGAAIGEHDVTTSELCALARRAAEAHRASGDAQAAIALYRRALSFDPASKEVLTRIDELLRDQGSPRERVALYRTVLASGDAEPLRRRELVHRIAAIEWHDLRDAPAAIESYRAALGADPDDADAHQALAALYTQSERWGDLSLLLERRLARADGTVAREIRARLAEVAASHGDEERARSLCSELLDDAQIASEHLDAIDRAAGHLGDAVLAQAVLARRAEMAQDPRERIGWLDCLAELDERRLGDFESAAVAWKSAGALAETSKDDELARRLYRRALRASPADRQVIERLIALCERAELGSELPDLYAALADPALEPPVDDAERADLALRTARLQGGALGDARGAAESAARALELSPGRADVLSAFETFAVADRAFGLIETTIDGIVSRADPSRRPIDPDAHGQLLLTRARALGADASRVDDAARSYRLILEEPRFARHHGAAASVLDALVAGDPRSPGRQADLRWLLEWRAEHAPPRERIARLLEWARAEETAFGDPAKALALHERVLSGSAGGEHENGGDSEAADERTGEALAGVARLALATGHTEDALCAMRAQRNRVDGAALVALELAIAEVLLTRTTRWPEALAALRSVLASAPGEPAARPLALQLLAHRATRADAVAMLEQAADSTDDRQTRAEILMRLIDAPTDPEDTEARRRWFEQLSDLQREGGNDEEALATASRAARELPQVEPLWDRAEELARALSRPNDVAALYEEVLARALPQELAVRLGERAVRFYEEWFDDSARVVAILERVLELEPTADWAFDRLKLVLDAAERWDDLFVLYDRALASSTGSKRTMLLEDAAQTAKDFADRPDRAIRYLEQLQEITPGDAKLAAALERLYERQGKHRELVSLLSARLPTLRPDEARRTRARVAALWLDELGDPTASIDTIEPLLENREPDDRAVSPEVWALLERVLVATPPSEWRRSSMPPRSDSAPRSKRSRKSEAPAPAAPLAPRTRAAAWLRDHYARAGQDADLARMLLVELETVRPAKERIRRHLQVAELYEKLGDLTSALEQTGQAVVHAPGDEARRAKLRELAERTGRLDRLADVLSAAAESADDPPLRIGLLMQAAEVRADRMGDAAGGIALLASLLSGDALPEDAVLGAARKLEPLLEVTGRADERLDVVERIAHVEPDESARRGARGRAARLATELGQHSRAVALWEARVTADERDGEALDGLIDLLDRLGDNERLAQVLDLRARASTNVESRRADRVRVAKLLGDVIHRPDDAIDAWRAVERDFGEADDAAVALSALLHQTSRWPELAAVLARQADAAEEASARAELLRQLGDVHRVELGAHELSVSTYARALEVDPRSAGARAGLQALAEEGAHRAAAVGVLLAAFRACDDWQALLDLTPHRLLAASSREAELAVLLEAAEISEQRAGNHLLAFEAMRRAFAISPANEAVQLEIERLAAVGDAWPHLVDAYREAIEGSAHDDAPLVLRLWRKLGTVLETRVDDPRGALGAYLRVLSQSREADVVDAGCAAVRVAAKLAEWDVAAQAVVDLARAQRSAPVEAFGVLEQAAAAAGAWTEALGALDRAVAASDLEGPPARDLHARAAELHRDRRHDPDAAEEALRRALEHDRSNAALLASMAELQRGTGGRPLVDTLLRLSRAKGGDLALLREACDVAADAVGDRPLACSISRELLELSREQFHDSGAGGGDGERDAVGAGDLAEPASPPAFARWAIERLARLHDEEGDARTVLEVLVAGDALPFAPVVRRDMRRRAARIALDVLADDDRAVALYGSLFDEDPHDVEASDRLATTYTKRGRVRDLLALRERQIASTEDVSARIELRLEAARLFVATAEVARAIETLHANLREADGNPPTVEALAELLDREQKDQDLRVLLADQAARAEEAGNTARAADLWSRAAVLAEERLRDAESSARYHARVVALDPRAASLDALARLAHDRGEHATAAEWLEKLVVAVDAPRRTAVLLRLGEALVSAGHPAMAAERLHDSLVVDPDAAPVRERLAALYREQAAWPKLARLVADGAAHAPDKGARLARLLEAAGLYVESCGDAMSAVPLLEQASDLAPEDQNVRLALAEALAKTGRTDDAGAVLQAMIDAFGGRRPKERAPVHYQIARLQLSMGNRARALVELDTATRVDPQNPSILRALAELARDDGQLDRAEKSFRALLVVLRRRGEPGGGPRDGGAVARSEVLVELSAIAEKRGEPDRAKEILESAIEAGAQSDFEQERLEGAIRARGDDDTLVRVLETKLARLADSPAAAKALAELADVLADRLDRPAHALSVRLRAVAMDPRSSGLHDAALALARPLGEVRRYVDEASALVAPAISADDAPLACELLTRIGAVAETDLKDDRRAAALYERAVELGQRSPELLRALEEVYGRLGDTDRQARVLSMYVEAQTTEGGPRAASDAIYRLAALRLASAETLDQGGDLMESALDLDPQPGRAIDMLRRALEIDPGRERLIALYERVGREPGHERTLVHALRLRALLPGSDVETVREAVNVATGIGDDMLAESLLETFAMTENARASDLSWALSALAGFRESAGDLARAVELKRRAARIAEPDAGRRLDFEAARLAAEKLNDLGLAAEIYEALREADPADREAWEPLVDVYRRLGDARKQSELLASVVEYVDDARERGRLRLDRVRTMVDGLGLDDAHAAPLLREILDEDPSQPDAALMLAGILERAGASDELTALLSRQIDAAKDRGDGAAIASLAERLGRLLETRDLGQARATYGVGLDWAPASRELLDALLRLLAAGGENDAAERADAMERRLVLEHGPGAEEMALSLAKLRADLGDEAAAHRALELGYAAFPGSVTLRDELEAGYRSRGEWAKVADLCVLDAGARTDREERLARLLEAATIRRTQVLDAAGAAAALRMAREVAPDDATLLGEHVGALLEANDPASAIAELGAALDRLHPEDERRAGLLGTRAGIRDASGDGTGALEDLEAAFTLDATLYAGALSDHLGRAIDSTAGDAAAVRTLRLRQAEVLPIAGDPDAARAVLGDMVRQDPKDRDALERLADLEVAFERWDAASAALRRLVGIEEGGAAVHVALRLADACERAGRPGDARGALERARLVSPEDHSVRERLERVYELTGAWRELAELALDEARASGDVGERFTRLLRAGSLLLEHDGDPQIAIDALQEARALRPADPECVGLLADAFLFAGRTEEAHAVIEQVIAPSKGRRVRELAGLYWRLSRVARALGDEPAEVKALVHALECDAQSGQVCSDVAIRAIDVGQLDLATRALRAVTLLKNPGPMSKGLAYQYMGEIARVQGDSKRALTMVKRALVEDPTLEGAKALLHVIDPR